MYVNPRIVVNVCLRHSNDTTKGVGKLINRSIFRIQAGYLRLGLKYSEKSQLRNVRTVHEGLQRACRNASRPRDTCRPPCVHCKACAYRKLCSGRSTMPRQLLTPQERSTTFIVIRKWHRKDGRDDQDGQGGHAALPYFTKRVSATDGVRKTDEEGLLSAGRSSYRRLWGCCKETYAFRNSRVSNQKFKLFK